MPVGRQRAVDVHVHAGGGRHPAAVRLPVLLLLEYFEVSGARVVQLRTPLKWRPRNVNFR